MIEVGNNVVWFSGSKRGRIVSMRKGYGVVKKIDGDIATVVTDCGGRVRKPLSELTLKDSDSKFSIFEKVAELI